MYRCSIHYLFVPYKIQCMMSDLEYDHININSINIINRTVEQHGKYYQSSRTLACTRKLLYVQPRKNISIAVVWKYRHTHSLNSAV